MRHVRSWREMVFWELYEDMKLKMQGRFDRLLCLVKFFMSRTPQLHHASQDTYQKVSFRDHNFLRTELCEDSSAVHFIRSSDHLRAYLISSTSIITVAPSSNMQTGTSRYGNTTALHIHTGCLTSWTHLLGVYHSWALRVNILLFSLPSFDGMNDSLHQ